MSKITNKQKVGLILFGIIACLVMLEGGLRVGGFLFTLHQRYRNWVAVSKKGDYTILCLGGSTTAGQWPPYLDSILNKSNSGIRFTVIDGGIPGANSGFILSNLKENLDKYTPHMVIAMMGINDGPETIKYDWSFLDNILLFFRNFRIYKLTMLLWQHIDNKIRFEKTTFAYFPNDEIPNSDYIRKGKQEQTDLMLCDNHWDKSEYFRGLAYETKAQGDYDKAETMSNKALALNPRNEKAYSTLASIYLTNKEWEKAKIVLDKLVEMNPKNHAVYCDLSFLYRGMGEIDKAIEILEEAFEFDPSNLLALVDLGMVYQWADYENGFENAIELYEKAVSIHPEVDRVNFDLGWFYFTKGIYDKAEKYFTKTININPTYFEAYSYLVKIHEQQGNHELASRCRQLSRRCLKEINRKHLYHYNMKTQHNYRNLKDIMIKRNIQLTCVQYPMRSVHVVKEMLRPYENIIFVDNEHLFKEALQKVEYNHNEYFKDMFAGDFGHCTKKGNRLLAENIARVILKEVFGKELRTQNTEIL